MPNADADMSRATAPGTRKRSGSSREVTFPGVRRLRGLFWSTPGCWRGQSLSVLVLGPKSEPCVYLQPGSTAHKDFSVFFFDRSPPMPNQASANTATALGVGTAAPGTGPAEGGSGADSNRSDGEKTRCVFISREVQYLYRSYCFFRKKAAPFPAEQSAPFVPDFNSADR